MPTISSDKRKKDLKCTGWINIKISGKKIAIFQNLTYQLQTQFSQLPNGQNAKFQCPSDAEFPEFFETGLFFILALFFYRGTIFFGTPCSIQ